jgi:TolB-like protein/Tfp pilus assembly protein PilF
MKIRGFLKELRHRGVFKVAVAYTATGIVVLEVLTHLFHNFEAPHWVLKVITTLLILGLPIACLMAWGFEFKDGRVRTVPREPEDAKPALPGPEATAPPPSIAVLPFEDMSAEHDQQYLGNGIAEELLNALASVEGLNVAARTSSFSFAGKGASMKEIGETLHVRHVLEGSVRRSGQKLRVTAQLIDVESGFHRYSQSYDRELQDIFDIQNEIAREIAGALLPRLGLGKDVVLVKHGTTNLQAYNLRLQARPWLTAPDPVKSSAAIDKLRQALELDPRYWDAWGDLAYVKGYMTSWTGDPVPLLVDAEAAATLALYHSPTNVIALLWRAFVNMLVKHDPATAADYYERARQAGVDQSLWAFQKAYCYDGPLGRFDAAIEELRDAERNDPLASAVKGALIEMYLGAGRPSDAVAVAETALAQELAGFDSLMNAGRAFVANGDFRRARELLDRSRAASGENHQGGMLLQFEFDAATGDRAGALQRIERLLQRRSEDFGISCYVIGEGCKAIGDYDATIHWWTSAVERHETWTLTLMAARNRNHPVLGKDPRFLALLQRMGLEESNQ